MKKQNCVVILGRFQPFHRGHVRLVNKVLEKDSSLPLVVMQLHSKNKKTVFPKDISYSVVAESLENCSDILYNINEYYIITVGTWNEGVEEIEKLGFNPIRWSVGPDRVASLQKYVTDYVDENAEVLGIEDKEGPSGTKVREALKDDNYKLYKELVCEGIKDKEWFELLKDYIK